MRRARARRRRLALATLIGLAAGAFVLGAALGDGRAPKVEVAETLPLGQLTGQRIVVGFSGDRVSAQLRRAIRLGEVAGVVLFAENLPSRAAGRRLIAAL